MRTRSVLVPLSLALTLLGAANPASAGPLTDEGCATVTLTAFDNIYSLVKSALYEALADIPSANGAAEQNRDALKGVLAEMDFFRTYYWVGRVYGGGGGRPGAVTNAEALQIFSTLSDLVVTLMPTQHHAVDEGSVYASNHGWTSFDYISQALAAIHTLRVDSGHCRMAYYR